MISGETAGVPVTQNTPLLHDSESQADRARKPDVVPDELSTKELLWILGSIWPGVFLAALGACSYPGHTSGGPGEY